MPRENLRITKWDADDLCWNLCEVIAEIMHLNYDNWTDFRIREISAYTKEQQETIYKLFKDAETFKKLRFYPGVGKISRVREVGGIPIIKSSSLSENVIEYKRWIFPRSIPGITEKDLELNLVDSNTPVHKKYEEGVLIAADDSPYNIAESLAVVNLMPMWQPWSRTKKAIETVADKNVVWLPSLDAMTDYAYQRCKLEYLQSRVL